MTEDGVEDGPTLERLHNGDWDFDSNCFVCEPSNASGLGQSFFVARRRQVVIADVELDDRFSGAPSYVHGGLVSALLDEAMAWATIALRNVFAVTKEITTRYRAPVRVDVAYRLTAEILEQDERALRCRATITDGDGTVCTEAHAEFVALGPARAADAIGHAPTGIDASFVAPADGDG